MYNFHLFTKINYFKSKKLLNGMESQIWVICKMMDHSRFTLCKEHKNTLTRQDDTSFLMNEKPMKNVDNS